MFAHALNQKESFAQPSFLKEFSCFQVLTAQGAFHATGISLFQHPSSDAPGEEREVLSIENQPSKKRLARLPDSYTAVRPVILPRSQPAVPPLQGPFVRICPGIEEAFSLEYKWLQNVGDELNREISQNILQISWAAFHANQPLPNRENQLGRSSLLPFQEEAASAAMICHAINVITKAVDFLNQGQVPVLACDQPLYAIAKKVQWNFPTVYGQKKLEVMFGGFHTDVAALKALGSWIEDSGWTSVLVQAGVTTPGTTDSFLAPATHIKLLLLLCMSLWIRHITPIGKVMMKEKSQSHSSSLSL